LFRAYLLKRVTYTKASRISIGSTQVVGETNAIAVNEYTQRVGGKGFACGYLPQHRDETFAFQLAHGASGIIGDAKMYTIDLNGKTGLIFGVANQRSIAWAIAQVLYSAGARLAFAYKDERVKKYVEKLVSPLNGSLLIECDVTDDSQIQSLFQKVGEEFGHLNYLVHSIAYAKREDLEGLFLDTSRDGFHLAMDISAYSLIPLSKAATPLMAEAGGSIVALSYIASQRALPNYNVMGTAKAALEHCIRQLAYELGEKNIRVNGISAGPIKTLAARAISSFNEMLLTHRKKAPLRRNIEPNEVAKTALYLLSDLSSGVTGEIIYVDAGYHILGF